MKQHVLAKTGEEDMHTFLFVSVALLCPNHLKTFSNLSSKKVNFSFSQMLSSKVFVSFFQTQVLKKETLVSKY